MPEDWSHCTAEAHGSVNRRARVPPSSGSKRNSARRSFRPGRPLLSSRGRRGTSQLVGAVVGVRGIMEGVAGQQPSVDVLVASHPRPQQEEPLAHQLLPPAVAALAQANSQLTRGPVIRGRPHGQMHEKRPLKQKAAGFDHGILEAFPHEPRPREDHVRQRGGNLCVGSGPIMG